MGPRTRYVLPVVVALTLAIAVTAYAQQEIYIPLVMSSGGTGVAVPSGTIARTATPQTVPTATAAATRTPTTTATTANTSTATSTATNTPAPSVFYVKHDAGGAGDGSSWANAYTDLQSALAAAISGDEIWVAAGVYYPARDSLDRTATFHLADGVALYGGFLGTETERTQRDWNTNITVLSGDLDHNDSTDSSGVVTDAASTRGYNAYHVVRASDVGETTVLDGFVVTAGLAEANGVGGGMYNEQSSVAISNVVFIGNSAGYEGGGMFNVDYAGGRPTLTNAVFRGNLAGRKGGGMANYGSPVLNNVVFTGNVALGTSPYGEGGGGLYTSGNPSLANVVFSGNWAFHGGGLRISYGSGGTLINVTFSGNSAGYEGGGMFSDGNPAVTNAVFLGNSAQVVGGGLRNTSGSSATMTNVTIAGNEAIEEGGGIYNEDSSPAMANCIVWGNAASTGPQIYNAGTSAPLVTYSNVQGGYTGMGNLDADPLFVGPVAAAQAPTTAGDYRLNQGSPAVDAGTNTVVAEDSDVDGNTRIIDGNGDGSAVVDMGAYEMGAP